MKNVIETKVRTEGKGDSKEKALNIALGNIQKKVMKDYKGNMIIRIEPIDVDVVEAKEFSYIERFLFFFFPRKRSKYRVVLDVKINLFLLNVEEINFNKVEQKNNIKSHAMGSLFPK
ncbi:DUF4312 family protein [Psychrobacillus psychrodurans]|uniref:DUF4312 family protein n=1 Tax=Psychrobacillus psychrodurans TaxID=126157 RepID=UPI0008EF49E3|nr:DUF4312 family protein [Psychrobacillus psychrodurans]MCZ8540524.1 DUF4312 family protein [Psychrobacillus psychrodurans]SFM68471.1 conserved hypothetical protein EF_0831/AHA_3912 [Psychrobacillus psychrodurans]